MSISETQKKRIITEVTKAFYATGEKPRNVDIMTQVSKYFSKYPVGSPLPVPADGIKPSARASVEQINTILAHATLNLDVLYESSLEQVEDIMMLTTTLTSKLAQLKKKRRSINAKVEDYLLSINNSDGYFFSVSDTFSDLNSVDLDLTTALIDTESGDVVLPALSDQTMLVPYALYRLGQLRATKADAPSTTQSLPIVTKASFTGAIDGLTNTVWCVETETDATTDVVLECPVSFREEVIISRIEVEPYGISPVQMWAEAVVNGKKVNFGGKVVSGTNTVVFSDNSMKVSGIVIYMRKSEEDYVETTASSQRFKYMFGMKHLCASQHVYDTSASFVSQALTLPGDLSLNNAIDAVSLSVDSSVVNNTDIRYYIAADDGEVATTVDDFDWKPIEPVGSVQNRADHIVRLGGAASHSKMIKASPSAGDLQLIPFNDNDEDLTKRNPSPVVIPTIDTYRIATFKEDAILESLKLEEGINTNRIYYTDLDETAVASLDFWTDFINGSDTSATIVYGSNEDFFFYGGDVGDSGKSVYVETFLESATDQDVLLREFHKVDANARTWTVRLFLNGRETGYLPPGTDSVLIPWKFQKGLNHICALINIPDATDDYATPYIGTVNLLGSDNLRDYGTVKLATWNYVDPFKMQHNETGSPFTFTIMNEEIVSRRRPTSNFRLRYALKTNNAPDAVRVRADLSRSSYNQSVTPSLNFYRLRFGYGDS